MTLAYFSKDEMKQHLTKNMKKVKKIILFIGKQRDRRQPPCPRFMRCYHAGWMILDQLKRGDTFFAECP
jgi:hypothetical protein